MRANISLREKTFGGPKGIECPGYVTLNTILRDMTPDITYAQTEPFCLVYDAQRQTYTGIAVGRRDARLLCKEPGRSLCQRVNDTKDAAMNVASLGTSVSRAWMPPRPPQASAPPWAMRPGPWCSPVPPPTSPAPCLRWGRARSPS